MSLDPADINSIVAALQESTWDQAVVQVGDVQIAVARNGASLPNAAGSSAIAPVAPMPSAPATESETVAAPKADTQNSPSAEETVRTENDVASSSDHVIVAPSVGVFWRQPEPGADPFVSVGDRVGAGDTVAIIEVMKLMNNLPAGVAGRVTAIHAQNSEAVEHGTPLFSIALEA